MKMMDIYQHTGHKNAQEFYKDFPRSGLFNPFTPVVPTGTTIFSIFYCAFKKHICFPYFCYWITTNQIDHLVKRGSIKGLIFFAMSWRKSKKRRLIFGPPGMNGLRLNLI